ncbi:MAG: glycosyltransferase [Candidatus ainarchaeum sp.]|nr:glycosyltransferase [Candidatus ainarchaeum sp.]MDD5096570.1 glycosyltransferase [Candidatus ainarchaeum sp.]
MVAKPEVSIVVPTYNEQKYIRRALEGLFAQKADFSYEIIVSDGNSTDSTAKIARGMGARVVFEPKRTIAAGRQKGFMEARGKIIVSSSADVYVKPDWLAKLVEPIRKRRCIASGGPVIPKDGNLLEQAFAKGLLTPAATGLSRIGMPYVVADNMAIRADVFRKIGGFDTDMVTAEDTYLIKKARKYGKFRFVKDAPVYISMRRVREWGYSKYLLYHGSNFFKYHFTGKSHSKYEPIR